MNNKRLLYILITSVCLLFVLQPFFFNEHGFNEGNTFVSAFCIKESLANGFMILFFYFNYISLLEKYFYTKKYVQYFIIVIGFFVCTIAIPNLLTGNPKPMHFHQMKDKAHNEMHLHDGDKHKYDHHQQGIIFEEVKHHIALFFAVTILSMIIKMRTKFLESEILRKQSELNMLNAQVSPHFLFNALNTLYILAIKDNAKVTSEATLQLSNLLRYTDKDFNESNLFLTDELKLIIDYIDFQKLRFGDSVHVNIIYPTDIPALKIGTLLLMPFVENAFKYGVNPDKFSEINIKISLQNSTIFFECVNQITISKVSNSTGIGISNTKKRLEILYPNRHQLSITNVDNIYTLYLKIDLV